MTRGRSIIRYLSIGGLLTCIVAVIAPAAYGGEDILPNTPEPPPVVTSTVAGVTETAQSPPTVEGAVEQVNTATAPVTETVSNAAQGGVAAVESVEPVEPAEVVQNVPSTSVTTSTSTSTPETTSSSAAAPTAPSSSDAPATTSGGSGGTTMGTGAGGSSSLGSTSTTTGSGPSTRPAQMFPSSSTSFTPAERGSLRSAPGVFFAQAGDNPEDILDELLDIGNSVGVDQVRGLQITNARGSNNEAPEGSGAPSTPAPLALTGIAIGAFLAIGFGLLATGNGARAAASTSAA